MLRTRKALSLRVTLSSMASISGAASLRGNSEPSLYALRVLPTNFRDSSYKCWARGNSSASSTWGGGGAQSAFLIAGSAEAALGRADDALGLEAAGSGWEESSLPSWM